MPNQDALTRQNMSRSRVIVFVAFAANAGLNLVLLGILANWGGLELVGKWSFLNAILLLVTMADFGITNALTFRIGRDGVAEMCASLRTLLRGMIGFAVLCVLLGIVAGWVDAEWGPALALTVLAGLAQMASNWLIAIRMGQHQQYWFNVKTILRVVLQTIAVLGFYVMLPGQELLALGLAMCLSRLAELALAKQMTRRDFVLRGPLADLSQIVELAKGFGLLSLAQRGVDPLSRLLISALAGPVVLGAFTVAVRIPAVVNQSVSEALRALLPGLSQMRGEAEREKAINLLRDSVAGQLTLIGAPMIIIAVHANLLFQVWLGQTDEQLVLSLRILLFGSFISALSTPFFWTIQAFGDAPSLGRLMQAPVGIALILGGVVLWFMPTVAAFSAVYALSQVVGGALAFVLANRYAGLTWEVFNRLEPAPIVLFLIGVTILNAVVGVVLADLKPIYALILVLLGNAAISGPVGLLLLRNSRRR